MAATRGGLTKWSKLCTIRDVRDQLMKVVGAASEYGKDSPTQPAASNKARASQDELPDRKMADSFQECIIPLGQDRQVRDRYITFMKGLRFGRILEDLDTFAGWICCSHYSDPDLDPNKKYPVSVVTALVDRIGLHNHVVSPFHDIKMSGHVSWAGSSSMEVTMDLEQQIDNAWQKMLKATFVMVSRNPETSKAAVVNRLVPEGQEEIDIFKQGQASKLLRQEEAKKALLKHPPNQQEIGLIHDMFKTTINPNSGTFKVRVKPNDSEWMDNAILKNVIMCHPEQRNIHGKIFGGFLMRQAMELAWINAAKYSRSRPVLRVVDDIVFKKSVDIGSTLMLSSQIVYTEKSQMEVKVHAEVLDVISGEREITNDFHFTFDSLDDNLPQVVPKSYAESMLYLDGKRHFES